jgi:hypothetical protein
MMKTLVPLTLVTLNTVALLYLWNVTITTLVLMIPAMLLKVVSMKNMELIGAMIIALALPNNAILPMVASMIRLTVTIPMFVLLIGVIVKMDVNTRKLSVMTTVLVPKILVMNNLVALIILFPVMIITLVP